MTFATGAALDVAPVCLLESAAGYAGLGDRSIYGCRPWGVLRATGREILLVSEGSVRRSIGDPLDALRAILAERTAVAGSGGGAIGYIGYNLCHQIEDHCFTSSDDIGCPDLCFALYDELSDRDPVADLHLPPPPDLPLEGCEVTVTSNLTQPDYEAMVRRAMEYIADGDIYEVNVSQRFHAKVRCSPEELYYRLRVASPAPFGAHLDFGDHAVISSSPERFWRLTNGLVEARPMKGTRPRGESECEDAILAQELYNSVKDRAENVMIVDLMRNDIGRVCEYGSVSVPELFRVESYATVHQMTSTVTGTLRRDLDAIDLLRATFPPGSMTGAPKIRAMEIIDELEPAPRGAYSGVLGWIGYNGDAEFSVIIRTIIQRSDEIWFQVGGAIVADSDPTGEYIESMDKAQGIFRALGVEG